MQFSEGALESQVKHAKLLEHLANQKKARELVVPTDDFLVQLRLRELSEPIRLFGESKAARRERLRSYLANHGLTQGMPESLGQEELEHALQKRQQQATSGSAALVARLKEHFFYPGDPTLARVRTELLGVTLERAEKRLCVARERRRQVEETVRQGKPDRFTLEYAQLCERFKRYQNVSSDLGGDRPLSSCVYGPRGLLATTNWAGGVRVFNDAGKCVYQVAGAHEDRAQHVQWLSEERLMSCGADNAVKIWDCSQLETFAPAAVLRGQLDGHTARVNRVCTHPLPGLALSTSFDGTWRLWDLNAHKALGVFEGHVGAVYGVAAQSDGALVATSGLDGLCRVWDLRSGRAVAAFRGHVKMALTVDFSPDGFRLVTGSDDNTIRVWDLRRQAAVYTIAAHLDTVSHLKFFAGGEMLASCSFDGSLKVWGMRDHTCLALLAGHDSRVAYCDVNDQGALASCGFDKTIKRWGE